MFRIRYDSRTILALVTTLTFWASSFAGIRAALASYQPGHVALLRFLVASTCLAAYALITRTPLPNRRDIPLIVLLGFLGYTVYHLGVAYGEVTVTAGAASLLIASNPVFTSIIALIFLKERFHTLAWVGIAVSFIGVAVIAFGEGEGFSFAPGVLYLLLASFSEAFYFVFQKPLFAKYSALQMTMFTIWTGTAFMLFFAPGLPQAIQQAPLSATLAIVYLGIFPAAIGYFTWTVVLSRIPAGVATSFLYLSPVLAIFIAWVWLGEVPALASLIGGAIVLAGVVMVNSGGVRKTEVLDA
ncbi:MAG: DMT family transporter [Anaerolineae bacterium]|nr:DMT family transporter [Anaerolineae bacterium]